MMAKQMCILLDHEVTADGLAFRQSNRTDAEQLADDLRADGWRVNVTPRYEEYRLADGEMHSVRTGYNVYAI